MPPCRRVARPANGPRGTRRKGCERRSSRERWRRSVARPAEPAVAADRAGMAAFRGVKSTEPARLLNFIVRPCELPRECPVQLSHPASNDRDALKAVAEWANTSVVLPHLRYVRRNGVGYNHLTRQETSAMPTLACPGCGSTLRL